MSTSLADTPAAAPAAGPAGPLAGTVAGTFAAIPAAAPLAAAPAAALAALAAGDPLALFLDFDGTLVDIAATPDGVHVPAELAGLLMQLEAALGGALAFVTGRPIRELDGFLTPFRPVAAGVHGAEIRPGRGLGVARPAGAGISGDVIDDGVLAAVRAFAAGHPALQVELKGAAIAVHYRADPARESAVEAGLEAILASGPDHLVLCRGRKVFEIVPRAVSKGEALRALAALPVFAGRRPVMIGDDVSDETALAAARAMGGFGLQVAGEHFSAAAADFSGPAAVRGWLAALIGEATR